MEAHRIASEDVVTIDAHHLTPLVNHGGQRVDGSFVIGPTFAPLCPQDLELRIREMGDRDAIHKRLPELWLGAIDVSEGHVLWTASNGDLSS